MLSVVVRQLQVCLCFLWFFFQAEDGIRDLVRSRGLGDVYKRQPIGQSDGQQIITAAHAWIERALEEAHTLDYSDLGLSLIHI